MCAVKVLLTWMLFPTFPSVWIGAQSVADEIIKFKNKMEGTGSALKFVINAGDSFYSLGVTKACEMGHPGCNLGL